MAFAPEFLDEIRQRVGLVGTIGRRVKLVKRGREHTGLCPFHNEKSPSFTVSEAKGFYHCFGCGAHGDVIGFAMRADGLSFPEAVERLAGEAGLPVPESTQEEREAGRRRADLLEVMEIVATWFEGELQGAKGAGARAYLEERAVSPESVSTFRLGFAPDERGGLRRALHAKGLNDAQLMEGGLIKPGEADEAPRDYFFNRLIFPITDWRGRVIAFGGRALGRSPAKYINSPETPLFHKGRQLYNLPRARQAAHETGELVIAEGYMDVIALSQGGFPAAVAPLGTAVTEAQIAQLWRLAAEPILCLDGDEAGRRAAHRVAERALPLLEPGKSLRFALLPEGQDPDSLIRDQGSQALRAILDRAQPLASALWHGVSEARSLDTPERRAELAKQLREMTRLIRNDDVREAYRAEFERRLEGVFAPARADRKGRAWHRGHGRRDKRPLAPAGPGIRRPPEQGRHRQEQILLATALNHPELLAENAEALAALNLGNRDLDRLRKALIDLVSLAPDLDSDDLKDHLSEQGFTPLLESLLSREVYQLGPSARPDTPLVDARAMWHHIFRARSDPVGESQAVDRSEETIG
jgi:DNA primase